MKFVFILRFTIIYTNSKPSPDITHTGIYSNVTAPVLPNFCSGKNISFDIDMTLTIIGTDCKQLLFNSG